MFEGKTAGRILVVLISEKIGLGRIKEFENRLL